VDWLQGAALSEEEGEAGPPLDICRTDLDTDVDVHTHIYEVPNLDAEILKEVFLEEEEEGTTVCKNRVSVAAGLA
jgi:hypothetical protein